MDPWVPRDLPSAGFRPCVGLLLSQSPCNPRGFTSSAFWSLHDAATSLGQSTVLGWKLESDCVCMACVRVCAACEWPSMEACVLSAHVCMCLHVGLCACVYVLCPSMPVCMHASALRSTLCLAELSQAYVFLHGACPVALGTMLSDRLNNSSVD